MMNLNSSYTHKTFQVFKTLDVILAKTTKSFNPYSCILLRVIFCMVKIAEIVCCFDTEILSHLMDDEFIPFIYLSPQQN